MEKGFRDNRISDADVLSFCDGLESYFRRRFVAALLPRLFGTKFPGHTTREPLVGIELVTNGIQLYAIANLDKTPLY